MQEVFNRGNLDVIPEILPRTPSFTCPTAVLHGQDGVSSFIAADRRAFPDLFWLTEDLSAARDVVIHRYIGYGTFTDEWFGIPPNGAHVKRPGIATLRVRDGRVIEVRVFGIASPSCSSSAWFRRLSRLPQIGRRTEMSFTTFT